MKKFLFVLVTLALSLPAWGQGSPTLQFKTVAEMVAHPVPSIATRLSAIVSGRSSTNDGGGGVFTYEASDATSTNLGTVFKPTVGNGRWLRQYSGALNVKWFGAKGDAGTTDNYTAIQAAIDTCYAAGGGEVYIPPDSIWYGINTGPVHVKSGVSLRLHGTLKNPNGVNRMVVRIGDTNTMTFSADRPVPVASNCALLGDGRGVIDQNSQNSQNWDLNSPVTTSTDHAVYAVSLDGLIIDGVTVQNCNAWAISVAYSKNASVSNCRVLSGRGSNRYDGAFVPDNLRPLGGADGIHWLDCYYTRTVGNHVESSDDCVSITSNYSDSFGHVVSGNVLKHIALINTVTNISAKRSTFTVAISGSTSAYGGQSAGEGRVSDVTFTGNNCSGGAQWYYLGNDLAGSNTNLVTGVVISGNVFHDFTDDCATSPYEIYYGAIVEYARNISIQGNVFRNCNRYATHKGVTELVYEGNLFERFGNLPNSDFLDNKYAVLYFGSDSAQGACDNIRVLGNIFRDLAHCAVFAGSPYTASSNGGYVEIADNLIESAVTNNTATTYGYGVLNVRGHSEAVVTGNHVLNSRSMGINVVACSAAVPVLVSGNVVINAGYNNSMTDAYGLQIAGSTVLLGCTEISRNFIQNVDAYGITVYNPGQLSFTDNSINNPGRQGAGVDLGLVLSFNVETGSSNVCGVLSGNIVKDSATAYYFGYSGITTNWAGTALDFTPENISHNHSVERVSFNEPAGVNLFQHGPKTIRNDLTIIDSESTGGTLLVVSTASGDKAVIAGRSNASNWSGLYDQSDDIALHLRDDAGNLQIALQPDASSYIVTGQFFGIATNAPTEALEVLGNVKATGFIGDGSGLTGVSGTGSTNIADNGFVAEIRNATVATNLLVGATNVVDELALKAPLASPTFTGTIGWADVILNRQAANTLALRNAANAQTFQVNGTYTDASNYRRINSTMTTAGAATISAEGLGTGATGNTMTFGTDGTNRWQISNAGHFLASTDNVYDIGANGATRPRSIYISGAITVSGGGSLGGAGLSLPNTQRIQFGTDRSKLWSPADGVLLLTEADTNGFSGIKFGGETASEPYLKRSGTGLQVRLADDSGDAPLSSSTLTVNSAILLSAPEAIGTRISNTGGTIDRSRIYGTHKALTDAGTDNIVLITCPTNEFTGGTIFYTVNAKDASNDGQAERGQVEYVLYNKDGAGTPTVTEHDSIQSVSAGTLTTTWSYSLTSGTNLVITLSANTSLTPAAGAAGLGVTYTVQQDPNSTHSTITPQ